MKHSFLKNRELVLVLLSVMGLQVMPVSSQQAVPDSLVRERLGFIRNALESGKPRASLWWNGWLIGYGAATIGQAAVGMTAEDQRTRQDMALGAATTGLGVIGQLLYPMTPSSAPGLLSGISETTPGERSEKLAAAEDLLRKSAAREREGRSWQTHAITGLVNLGGGLVTWLGFKRSIWDGVGYFVLNTAITEAQIWTQPTRAVRDEEEYIRRRAGGRTDGLTHKIHVSFGIVPGGIGITAGF
ncbi:hypothetical protein JW906_06545 [bacterium]|nr:hypothetical protein [bacterium]